MNSTSTDPVSTLLTIRISPRIMSSLYLEKSNYLLKNKSINKKGLSVMASESSKVFFLL